MLLALCLVLEKITVYRPKNNCPVRYCNSVSFHGFMTLKKKKKKDNDTHQKTRVQYTRHNAVGNPLSQTALHDFNPPKIKPTPRKNRIDFELRKR